MPVSEITKVSEITADDLRNYLRIAEISEADENYLSTCLNVAKEFIKSYTGIDDEAMDSHVDLITVVFVLVSDMYDNRAYYVDKTNMNLLIESILNLHSTNLIPKEST